MWIECEIGCAGETDHYVEGDIDHPRGIDARH
jgi:hypothetical protein